MSNKQNKKTKFENKKVEFKVIGQKTNYFEMSIACLEAVKPEGITTGGMRRLYKLIDKLEDAKEKELVSSVEFNKEEAKILLSSVKNMSWTIADRQILQFEDYINTLI